MAGHSTKKSNTLDFIEKAKTVHGDKYDYSNVNYVNNKTHVSITCQKHGDFKQTPNAHLRGNECPCCANIKRYKTLYDNGNKQRLTSEDFIKKAKGVHGDVYDYSRVEYINNYTDVEIICSKHGSFFQKPYNHLSGTECPKCSHEKQRLSNEMFIAKAKQIHGDKYDYQKVEYTNNHTKVCIICPEHGEFWQEPQNHLNGNGCYECAKKNFGEYKALTLEDILEKFKSKHGDKYDYSSFMYCGYDEKSVVTCKEHGPFLITPHSHINGHGCKHCANKYLLGETSLKNTLEKHFDRVLYQVKSDTVGFEWLGKQSLDFYIPEINTAIEYQGEQHFTPIRYWGGEKKFAYTRELDIEKNKKATDNKVNVIYFRYGKIDIGDFPYNVIFDENELLETIQKERSGKKDNKVEKQ